MSGLRLLKRFSLNATENHKNNTTYHVNVNS